MSFGFHLGLFAKNQVRMHKDFLGCAAALDEFLIGRRDSIFYVTYSTKYVLVAKKPDMDKDSCWDCACSFG